MAKGEKIFLIAMALVAMLWVAGASQLTFTDDSIPASGFVPMIFAVVFLGLVVAILFSSKRIGTVVPTAKASEREPKTDLEQRDGRNKILKILGGLVVTIGIFEIVGASLAIFSLLFFLIKIVEHRSSLQALLVSAITTLILHLLFKTWLGVPLPAGPWGF